jgi:hypothetical protein
MKIEITENVIREMFNLFQITWHQKWTTAFVDDKIYNLALRVWQNTLITVKYESLKKTVEYMVMNLEWPPCPAQVLKKCESYEGVPDEEEAFRLITEKKFINPFVKLSCARISAWEWSHNSEEVIREKFKHAYQQTLDAYRAESRDALKLNNLNENTDKELESDLDLSNKIKNKASNKSMAKRSGYR